MTRSRLALAAAPAAALLARMTSEIGPVGPGDQDPAATSVLLTDAPFPFDLVRRADVHITEIAISPRADTSDGSPDWIRVAAPDRRWPTAASRRPSFGRAATRWCRSISAGASRGRFAG